jgi:hypothetical protein
MSAAQLDTLCQAALTRLSQSLNRSAAQHVRWMRESWRTP